VIRDKLREWFKRYAFAEFLASVFTIVFSNIAMGFFGNYIVAGFVGTWADNLGFYGVITYRDLKAKGKNKKITSANFFRFLRNMIVEFGPAEYLDSFIIRPFYLSVFPYFIDNYTLAIFIATILANITYYIPTIISYEFRKKVFKES